MLINIKRTEYRCSITIGKQIVLENTHVKHHCDDMLRICTNFLMKFLVS